MQSTGRPPRPTRLRRALFRLPIQLCRARLGWLLGHRMVLINHVGRKTGRIRQAVVEVASRNRTTGAVTVASGFGPDADWYRNLLAYPEVTIQLGSRSTAAHAVPLSKEDGAESMAEYSRRHPRAARSLARFMGFTVDGSEDDFRSVGRQVPFVRLEPRRAPMPERQPSETR